MKTMCTALKSNIALAYVITQWFKITIFVVFVIAFACVAKSKYPTINKSRCKTKIKHIKPRKKSSKQIGKRKNKASQQVSNQQ